MKTLIALALILLVSPAYSASICQELFAAGGAIQKQDAVALATAEELVKSGADPLTAARLATSYPEIAERILSRQAKGKLEWMVLYRGITGTIEEHNPYYFRVMAPLFRIGLNNGIDTSSDFATALSFAIASPYAKGGSNRATVLEFKVPKFLVRKSLLGIGGDAYSYIARNNTPELDLWITQTTEFNSREALMHLNRLQDLKTTWQPYSDHYFSEARSGQAPGPLLRTMMRVYRIWNRLLL